MSKPVIAISSCILGNNVRYDGGNTYDEWIAKNMGLEFNLRAICPEVAMGMPIPREAVNLVLGEDGQRRMMGNKTHTDHTENALKTSEKIINDQLNDVSGVILQKKSPSCGVERVKLYNHKYELQITEKNSPKHRGLFANALLEAKPLLPIIENGRLFDKEERENFLRRVMCYFRFNQLDGSIHGLSNFHARYKFVIMEHNQENMRKLGNIAANSKKYSSEIVYNDYAELLFTTLKIIPSRKSQTNVFQHLLGFFKNEIDSNEKKMIHQMIMDFHAGHLPYLVPMKMIDFLINKYQQYYLKNHYYLDQFPSNLRHE